MNLAIQKISSGRAENKIGRTFDVTIAVILAAGFAAGKDGILVAQDTAIDKTGLITLYMQSHSLSQLRGVVFDGQVLSPETMPLNQQGVSSESAHFNLGARYRHIGVIAPANDGAVSVFAQ